jgi:hypothetical protein
MVGMAGVVSITDVTQQAIADLGGPVREAIVEALSAVADHGTYIATETGWHGGSSQVWHDDFAQRAATLISTTSTELDELVTWATRSFEDITGAGGGLAG